VPNGSGHDFPDAAGSGENSFGCACRAAENAGKFFATKDVRVVFTVLGAAKIVGFRRTRSSAGF
jgi:hypothetical protein